MSQKPTRISAIVPTHNSQHIEACLRSILRQTEASLREIIVVDDASTDDTVDRILEVKAADVSKRVELLRLEPNSGPSAAKNAGIATASGDYIVTVDSDMVLEEGCLRQLKGDLLEAEASAAMAYFLVPHEMRVLTRVIGYDLEFRLSRVLKGRPWREVGKLGTGATLFVKKDLQEAGLFDETRRVGEDTALSYRLGEMRRRLVISSRARCWHYWQSRGWIAYVRQQVGYGEGIVRAYLDAKGVPRDPVSSPLLRVNALLAAGSVVALLVSPFVNLLVWFALALFLMQIIVDLRVDVWISARRRDVAAGLLAPLVFLVRNYSWAASLVTVVLKLALTRRSRDQPS